MGNTAACDSAAHHICLGKDWDCDCRCHLDGVRVVRGDPPELDKTTAEWVTRWLELPKD